MSNPRPPVGGGGGFIPAPFGFVAVRYPTSGPTCGAGRLEVKTFAGDQSGLSIQVAFTVNVP